MLTVAEQFGQNLYRIRKWAFHSQDSLAAVASLHRTHISALEQGRREPRLETIIKLADALGVDPGELVKGIALDWES